MYATISEHIIQSFNLQQNTISNLAETVVWRNIYCIFKITD